MLLETCYVVSKFVTALSQNLLHDCCATCYNFASNCNYSKSLLQDLPQHWYKFWLQECYHFKSKMIIGQTCHKFFRTLFYHSAVYIGNVKLVVNNSCQLTVNDLINGNSLNNASYQDVLVKSAFVRVNETSTHKTLFRL